LHYGNGIVFIINLGILMLKFENYQFLLKIFTNKKACQLWNNLKSLLYFTKQNTGKFLPENAGSYWEQKTWYCCSLQQAWPNPQRLFPAKPGW